MAENLEVLNWSWKVVTDALSPQSQASVGGKGDPRRDDLDLDQALQVLERAGTLPLIPAWFQQSMQDDIRRRVVTDFWKLFDAAEHPEIVASEALARRFPAAVDYLHSVTQAYAACLPTLHRVQRQLGEGCRAPGHSQDSLPLGRAAAGLTHTPNRAAARGSEGEGHGSEGVVGRLLVLLKAFLFSTFPTNFRRAVELFYSNAFVHFQRDLEDSSDSGADQQDTMEVFSTVNLQLHRLGLLEHVAGTAITTVVTDHIRAYIQKTCRGDFETHYLQHLEKYLDTKVLEWLRHIYRHSAEKGESIVAFRGRLMHFICRTHAQVLIDQLFSIVIEFPDSEPALQDLRLCLEKIDLRATLVNSLRSSIEVRLLHPGVNTADILTAYISAIRALRVLDPAGVILELVCEPVRKYLRLREDTVRCIVSSLTDSESNELMEELLRGAPQHVDERIESDDETEAWDSWQPDPVDANPETACKRRKEQDIISTLVNVYGSQELFVSEYRTLLADRLLSASTATIAMATAPPTGAAGGGNDLERELRYLELLKLRFGETPLHGCQVMLKDVADSRRINSRILEVKGQSGQAREVDMNAIILSAQFWPAFREEKITLPPALQSRLDAYTQQYETLKGNRTLVWKPHLGAVNIELELKGGQLVELTVSPVQAALIMQFQEQNRWTVEELSHFLEMTPSVVRRKLAFWQGQGLVREEATDVFVLVEDRRPGPPEVITADDDMESAMASAAQQREEEMQMFWTYITGMLQNLDCLPLERIHAMLRMFALQGPESGQFSQLQLKEFLDRKVRTQQLTFSSGVYRLPKN